MEKFSVDNVSLQTEQAAEAVTYKVGNMLFVVQSVFKESGESLGEILLKLMKDEKTSR